MTDAADRLSDECMQHFTEKVFPTIAEWNKRTSQQHPPTPEPHSSLRGDDKRTDPFQSSHAIYGALVSALDHLDALRALMQDVSQVHARAPLTLLRAAFESAATAVWMLEPAGDRQERVVRRLRLHWRDLHYRGQAANALGASDDRHPSQERVLEVADAYGIPASWVTKKPSYLEIVDAAGRSPRTSDPGPYAAFIWQMCSGIAHSQIWAILGFLDAREFDGSTPDTVTMSITVGEEALQTATSATLLMMQDAWDLFDERCKSYLR